MLKIHFEIISLHWVEWLFCEALIVWHLVERVLQEKRKIDSGGKLVYCVAEALGYEKYSSKISYQKS